MAIQQATIWYIQRNTAQLEPYLANGGPKFTTTVETLATGYVNILPSVRFQCISTQASKLGGFGGFGRTARTQAKVRGRGRGRCRPLQNKFSRHNLCSSLQVSM